MSAKTMSSRNASHVGMMEGAFFVSRTELLAWVNSLLQVSLTKIEQCASGAIYCQILDACHPGSIAMRKVNWMARADHEFIPNYKVLQAAFDRLGIEKHIDVDKLIRAKYQDNLEFLQWMKCYWDRERSACEDYDPMAPRETKPVPQWARPTSASAAPAIEGKENVRPRAAAAAHPEAAAKKLGASASEKVLASRPSAAAAGNTGGASRTPRVMAVAKPPQQQQQQQQQQLPGAAEESAAQKKLLEECRAQVASQSEEMEEMRAALDGLERERDYYFKKLRRVEIFCETLQAQMDQQQEHQDASLTPQKMVQDIQTILYAAEDEERDEGDGGDAQ